MDRSIQNTGNALPVLGVGITYSSELDPLLEEGIIDVIEVEPQTLWMRDKGAYRMPEQVITHLNRFTQKKLIHSVGLPVGGTFRGDRQQIQLLVENIEALNAPWASEHLGFNMTTDFFTGFFLPPEQTQDGVERAVQSIKFLKQKLPVPFAVETGVNYLKPRKHEVPDGKFVAEVIRHSDCGLLLDLHNLYTNELNGRQSIEDFLKYIPLDRVWEIHLAGGLEMDGFWLDAHSGNMPDRLISIASEVVQHLPNLKAIIYELLPSYLPMLGLKTIEQEILKTRTIWEKRCKSREPMDDHPPKTFPSLKPKEAASLWEESLGALAIGRDVEDNLHLREDPGIPIIRKLIQEFRASMLVSVFRLTSRFIILALGVDTFKVILDDFWKKNPPHPFASDEAHLFAHYLKNLSLDLPNLSKVLEFEETTLRTLLDNQTRVVSFDHDPFPLLRALSEGKLETMERQEGQYEIEITGDYSNGEMWRTVMQTKVLSH